jgi:hypothetical protein
MHREKSNIANALTESESGLKSRLLFSFLKGRGGRGFAIPNRSLLEILALEQSLADRIDEDPGATRQELPKDT